MRRVLVLLIGSTVCAVGAGSAQAVDRGHPVLAFGTDGAYVNSVDLSRSLGLIRVPHARTFAKPFGPDLSGFRYSGADRPYGATPTSNTLTIKMTRGHSSAAGHHVGAWQGITGQAACGGVFCNWVQAGIAVGDVCFQSGTGDSQFAYLEINYNGTAGTSCPATNGDGYLQVYYGFIGNGTAENVTVYNCGNTGGCSYPDSCTGFTFTSSYHRAAISLGGCIRTSNVNVDSPNGSRQLDSALEDYDGGLVGDTGTATFSGSGVLLTTYSVGARTCTSPAPGTGVTSYTGCLN